jgi:hypothetical protein
MKRNTCSVWILLCLFLTVIAGEARSAFAQRSAATVRSIDDLLAEVAGQVPAFGGMFLDANGQLAIYLTDERQLDAARDAVAAVFGRDRVDVTNARALRARYSFSELKRWHDRHRLETLAVPGVVMTAIDKKGNRLRVGVESTAVTRALAGVLAGAGVPAEAVEIVVMDPVLPLQKLTDSHRPLLGGLQIGRLASNGLVNGCTLGLLAVRKGQAGFVTNSHCTEDMGVTEGSVFHQAAPDGASDNLRVGIEVADPPFFPGNGCPAGKWCRYSDSAFIARSGGASQSIPLVEGAFGQLAMPDNTLSIVSEYHIVGKVLVPIDGEKVKKVGKTTGLSSGEIICTCADFNFGDSGRTFLCQNLVEQSQPAEKGDSGAPVFQKTEGPQPWLPGAKLFGIAWGGTGNQYSFSAVPFIEVDLGSLRVFPADLGTNSAPEVKIVKPLHFTNVGSVGALNAVQLKADIVDYEGCCQSVTWTSDQEGVIAQGPDTEFIISKPGAHHLTVTVTDDDGATASHSILIGADTDLPKVTIVNPSGLFPLIAGALYVFSGTGQDPNGPFFAMPCGALTWTSTKPEDPFPVTGCNPQVTFSTPGPRIIVLSGAGALGLTAMDTVAIQVKVPSPGDGPTVVILDPPHNSFLDPFTPITVTGKAVDSDPGPLEYQWRLVQGSPPWPVLGSGTVNSGDLIHLPWKPSDHVGPGCGSIWVEVVLSVNNPSTGIGRSALVGVMVGYPPC